MAVENKAWTWTFCLTFWKFRSSGLPVHFVIVILNKKRYRLTSLEHLYLTNNCSAYFLDRSEIRVVLFWGHISCNGTQTQNSTNQIKWVYLYEPTHRPFNVMLNLYSIDRLLKSFNDPYNESKPETYGELVYIIMLLSSTISFK